MVTGECYMGLITGWSLRHTLRYNGIGLPFYNYFLHKKRHFFCQQFNSKTVCKHCF